MTRNPIKISCVSMDFQTRLSIVDLLKSHCAEFAVSTQVSVSEVAIIDMDQDNSQENLEMMQRDYPKVAVILLSNTALCPDKGVLLHKPVSATSVFLALKKLFPQALGHMELSQIGGYSKPNQSSNQPPCESI